MKSIAGSHRQLVDLLSREYECESFTLNGKKWHWKMRTGALLLARKIPNMLNVNENDVIFATSSFSLCELLSLRPELMKAHKILYFHENQLVYPRIKEEERDFQFGWTQILSCLVADIICFNSEWNRSSFLESIPAFINRSPDKEPKDVVNEIRWKSRVLYFPIEMDVVIPYKVLHDDLPLHIVWNHRWEHDKDPDTFFGVLFELHEAHVPFRLSVLGESFDECPSVFDRAKDVLSSHLVHFGYVNSKEAYYEMLSKTEICVSTAVHEFFGVSVLEAALLGNYCLCPNRLSYKEIFPRDHLYNTKAQLQKALKDFCYRPEKLRSRSRRGEWEEVSRYLWKNMKREWDEVLLWDTK